MIEVPIKPMSVNRAWRGRRFRSKEYIQYAKDLLVLLPRFKVPEGKLEIVYIFGFSNKRQDYDGAIKQFQDVLQEAYEFDDNRIYKATIIKTVVKKGSEFIRFDIYKYNDIHTVYE